MDYRKMGADSFSWGAVALMLMCLLFTAFRKVLFLAIAIAPFAAGLWIIRQFVKGWRNHGK